MIDLSEGERLIRVETKMDNIEVKIDELSRKMDSFIDKSEDRFASKWVEKVLIGGGTLVGTLIVGALMSLILIK